MLTGIARHCASRRKEYKHTVIRRSRESIPTFSVVLAFRGVGSVESIQMTEGALRDMAKAGEIRCLKAEHWDFGRLYALIFNADVDVAFPEWMRVERM